MTGRRSVCPARNVSPWRSVQENRVNQLLRVQNFNVSRNGFGAGEHREHGEAIRPRRPWRLEPDRTHARILAQLDRRRPLWDPTTARQMSAATGTIAV